MPWNRDGRAPHATLARVAIGVGLLGASLAHATFPGANGSIAYYLTPNGSGGDLRIARDDGSGDELLIHFPASAMLRNPAWSPDGKRIAFVGAVPSQPGHIFLDVADADGTNVALVLGGIPTGRLDTAGPTWSPDGAKLAYAIDDGIHVVDVATKQDARIVGPPPANVLWDEPSWSPLGDRVALRILQRSTGPPYNFRQDIGVVAVTGGAVENLTQNRSPDGSDGDAGCMNGFPDWSPDGSRIVYETGGCQRPRFFPNLQGSFPPTSEIILLDAHTRALTPLFLHGLSAYNEPRWSPSGEEIVCLGRVPGSNFPDRYFVVFTPDGSFVRSTGVTGHRPDWQPTCEAAGAGPRAAACAPNLPVVVNDAGDGGDPAPDDGKCDVNLATPALECTLRAALAHAARQQDATTIRFQIPGDATIRPRSPLPDLPALVTVDGGSETGVVLDGALAGPTVDGLVARGLGSSVRGLTIRSFGGNGILLAAGGGATISGNVVTANGGSGVRVEGASNAGNTISQNAIFGNRGLGIDLRGGRESPAGVTANDVAAADADDGPNGLMNFPAGVTAVFDGEGTSVSGVLDAAHPESARIEIFASSTPHPSGHGEGEVYVGSLTPTPSGTFAGIFPGRLAHPFVSATATGADGSTSEFSRVCGDPDGDGTPDGDGDGLCDDWERDGIDYDADGTVDLALPDLGADADRKDVFLEIDYMDCTRSTCTAGDVSHRPLDESVQDIVDAFAAAPVDRPRGIALHAIIDEPLPEIASIRFTARNPGVADDFDDLKLGNPPDPCGTGDTDAHFGTAADRTSPNCANVIGAKRLVFRYAIIAHGNAENVPGYAEAGTDDRAGSLLGSGDDFVIATAQFGADSVKAAGGQRAYENSVIMHELGHTLGLRHGGDLSAPNCRPNYLSVMSYGLLYLCADPTRPLDYSRQVLPSLEEANLDERVAIRGPAGRNAVWWDGRHRKHAPGDAPIDWNGSGSIDAGVAVDLTGECDPGALTALDGFEDWSHLRYTFRSSPSFAAGGTTARAAAIPEITGEQVLAIARDVDFDGDGVSNADDDCPAVADPDQRDTNGDGIGDACTPTAFADLAVTVRAALASEGVSYALDVVNRGPDTASGVVVEAAVPAGLTFVSSGASQGTCTGAATVRCTLGSLAADGTAAATIVARFDGGTAGSFTAHVRAISGDPEPANDWDTVETPASVTTTTVPSTVTTTTVPPAGCANGPTFASLLCRLDVLAAAVGEGGAFKGQAKLEKKLQAARAKILAASTEAKVKTVARRLKQGRKLLVAAKRLAAKRTVPPDLKATLVGALDGLSADARALVANGR